METISEQGQMGPREVCPHRSEAEESEGEAMSDKPFFAYVGYRACGCMCFAAVDKPCVMQDNAKEISKLLKNGIRIERVAGNVVRMSQWKCETCKPTKGKKR